MKKIYEYPEVTVFNVGVEEHLMQTNILVGSGALNNEEGDVNSNHLDDELSTPWYR